MENASRKGDIIAYHDSIYIEYLQHDYYTDIITFDYCEGKIEGGVIFLDALANYERIADHAKNVAGYVKEEMQ